MDLNYFLCFVCLYIAYEVKFYKFFGDLLWLKSWHGNLLTQGCILDTA